MWLLSTGHRLQEDLNTEEARWQWAARPPGATRRRLLRGLQILHALTPNRNRQPMLDTSGQKRYRDGPSVAARVFPQPVEGWSGG